MKKAIWMLALIPIAAGTAQIVQTAARVHKLETGIIRLQVRAESDSTADQTAKLLVRDTVLEHAEEWMPLQGGYAESLSALKAALPEIGSAAEETLRCAGFSQTVTADIRQEHFPARTYGDVTLPEGDYQALCIEIGSGEGQNWWCVMYPGLCLPAAGEPASLSTHFDSGTVSLIAEPERYAVRLKCVELWRALMNRLRQRKKTR